MPQLFVTTPVTRTFLCSYLVGWSFNWAIFTPRAAQPVITNALRSTIVSRDAILIIQSLNASHGSVLEIAQSGGPVGQFFCALPRGPSARSSAIGGRLIRYAIQQPGRRVARSRGWINRSRSDRESCPAGMRRCQRLPEVKAPR